MTAIEGKDKMKTNYQRLNQKCLYDLLVEVNRKLTHHSVCILEILTDLSEDEDGDLVRCGKFNRDCEKCIDSWLNREEV